MSFQSQASQSFVQLESGHTLLNTPVQSLDQQHTQRQLSQCHCQSHISEALIMPIFSFIPQQHADQQASHDTPHGYVHSRPSVFKSESAVRQDDQQQKRQAEQYQISTNHPELFNHPDQSPAPTAFMDHLPTEPMSPINDYQSWQPFNGKVQPRPWSCLAGYPGASHLPTMHHSCLQNHLSHGRHIRSANESPVQAPTSTEWRSPSAEMEKSAPFPRPISPGEVCCPLGERSNGRGFEKPQCINEKVTSPSRPSFTHPRILPAHHQHIEANRAPRCNRTTLRKECSLHSKKLCTSVSRDWQNEGQENLISMLLASASPYSTGEVLQAWRPDTRGECNKDSSGDVIMGGYPTPPASPHPIPQANAVFQENSGMAPFPEPTWLTNQIPPYSGDVHMFHG